MPAPNMKETFGPLGEKTLQDHESKWGFRLPDSYRKFLLKYNGGRPLQKCFKFKEFEGGSSVHYFLGLNGDYDTDILLIWSVCKDKLPKRFMPIAYDDGSNKICISVSGVDRGKVYFWDHETQADKSLGESPETTDNITLIADSFDEFLNGLHE